MFTIACHKRRGISCDFSHFPVCLLAALCDQHNVNGFPTFRYYTFGKFVEEYDGDRSATDFVSFMSDPPKPVPPEKADRKPSDDSRDELWCARTNARGFLPTMVALRPPNQISLFCYSLEGALAYTVRSPWPHHQFFLYFPVWCLWTARRFSIQVWSRPKGRLVQFNPFTPELKSTFSQRFKEKRYKWGSKNS